jgi:hypothetical protein
MIRSIEKTIRWARGFSFVLIVVFGVTAPGAVLAHDVPDQIILHGFVKPEGERLHLLVRVPLVMLLNINLPKRGPGFIAIDQADAALKRAADATAREIVLYEEGEPLAYSRVTTRISPPSDRSFATFDSARAHIASPPRPGETDVFWNQGYFDAHYEMPIRSAESGFSLDMLVAPGLRSRLKLVLRFLPPSGEIRAYELHYGSGPVHLDPSWYQAAASFVRFGAAHILDGADHLLFLLCLVLPFGVREWPRLVGVVTAFTVAHSITLITAAAGWVPTGAWFPPLVETLIAASIVFVAAENLVGANLGRRWVVTALFGLVHGFGFSFALREDLQLAGSHHLLSLLSFNVGVEIGQLVFVALLMPILFLLERFGQVRRPVVLLASALVAHMAWHWLVERFEELRLRPGPEVPPDMLALGATALLLSGVVIALWLGLRRAARRTRTSTAIAAQVVTEQSKSPTD